MVQVVGGYVQRRLCAFTDNRELAMLGAHLVQAGAPFKPGTTSVG
jgi:hypothetical protein